MFGGGSGLQSSWANPQPAQQQQQTGAFGQPSSFSQSTFGGASAFGQPQQQQQQPQHNPMFGNLGSTPAGAATGAFGAFSGGAAAQPANPAFGGSVIKPATGFGAFGGAGTSTFGSGGGFGAPAAPATNTFGGTSSAFGATSSAFGAAKPATGAFGAPLGTPEVTAPVTTGSSNPPYAATAEKDPSPPNNTLQYQTISCMPAYRGTSPEELRVQDYAQGRKTASTGGAFGGSAFAAPAANPSPFGGAAAPTTSAFGAAPATGAFGGTTAFGQTTPQQPATSTFGATNPQGTFGASTTQPAGAFGSATTGAFGQPATTGAFGGASAFAPKPAAGAFGTGGAFGAAPAASPFGQPQQQPQQAGNTFGTPQTQPTNAFGAAGAFGANNTAPKSIFGQPSSTQTPGFGVGLGAFGQQGQQQQQPQQANPNPFAGGTTNIFGTNNNTQQQQPSSIFGNNPTQPQPAANPFGGSIFGAGAQQQGQQPQPTNIFGGSTFNKPAGTGFGVGNGLQTQPTANLMGGQQQPNAFGAPNGLLGQPTNAFGLGGIGGGIKAPTLGQSNSTAPAPGSLFGNPLGGGLSGGFGLGASTLGGGLSNSFSAAATAPGGAAQGTLTASISQPINTNLPIFSLLPPGPRAVDLDQTPKKKVGFFSDIPTRSPLPRVQLGYSPASSKLRGFGSSVSHLGGSLNTSSLALSRNADNKTPDNSFIRSSSPALGSGQRNSVKKLVLDKKVEPSELFTKSGSSSPYKGGKVTFSPALGIAARESAATSSTSGPSPEKDSVKPAPVRTRSSPNRFTAASHEVDIPGSSDDLKEGDYYVKPDLLTLTKVGFDNLSTFKDLVVGRVGYGEIHFLEPVDLTGLLKLKSLEGAVIKFDDKECSVYPESDEIDKPPPGSGLNVPARIMLKRCWAVDKASREPIKDEKHPQAIKHLKKLKAIKDTHFESFNMEDGTWTFTVDHF